MDGLENYRESETVASNVQYEKGKVNSVYHKGVK